MTQNALLFPFQISFSMGGERKEGVHTYKYIRVQVPLSTFYNHHLLIKEAS